MDSVVAPLIQRYLAGPAALRQALEGLSADEIDSTPVARRWSIRQVVCHLADAEILYADRIRRILAEDEPTLVKADPERDLAALAVSSRDLNAELTLIEAVRTHVGQILSALPPEQFDRRGIPSADGPLTLLTVVERVTDHLPHHLAFVHEKRTRILELRS